jgi:hypothetical protein
MITAIALILIAAYTTVCALKGKPWFAILGVLLFGIFGIVGAIRLAKPHSWWARRFYGVAKQRRSWDRFEGTTWPAGLRHPEAGQTPPPAAPERPEQPAAWLPPAAR